MPDVAAQVFVSVALFAATVMAIGPMLTLARRHGLWSVVVPVLSLPALIIAFLYLPVIAPVLVMLFLASALMSRSRTVYRWLPWLIACCYGAGALLLAAFHAHAIVTRNAEWDVEGVVLVALLLIGAFFITEGIVEWGRWCARRVVWRRRYRETTQPTPAPLA